MSVVQDYIQGLHGCLAEVSRNDLEEIAGLIFQAYEKSKQVFVLGNGGSASTASHFARDMKIGTATNGCRRLKAIGLADNMALVTSLANDVSYNSIFEEQLIGQMDEGDIVIGISASGDSPNVLKAIEYARSHGAITIGLTGFGGGKLKEIAHKNIILSSRDYGQVEDIHMSLAHIICYIIREKIADGK